jgi:hypothetical protein
MEKERHETFAHLVESVGFTVDEAERAMRDDDLWVVPPGLRLEVTDEEAVEEWRKACDALGDLVHAANHIGLETMVAVMDAQYRAGIALERARERVRRAQEEG